MCNKEGFLKITSILILTLILFGLRISHTELSETTDQNIVKQIKTKLSTVQDTNSTSKYEPYSFINRIYIEAQVTTNIDITNTRVNFTSIRKLVNGWSLNIGSSPMGTQVMTTTIPPDEYDLETTISYVDLDAFLAAQFVSENYVNSMLEFIRRRLGGNITNFDLNIEFNGTSFYNKIPVIVFKVNGYMEAYSREFGLIKGSFSGYSYLYIGLPIPVHGSLTYRIETKAIGIENSINTKTTYYITEHNLENTVMYEYSNIDGLELIIAGFPRSNITVYIYANNSQIEVINSGSDIGYILIKSREPSYLNITGVRVKYTGFKLYGIHAGKNRAINIDFTPNRNITLNTKLLYYRERSLLEDPVVLTLVITVVLIIAFYVVFRFNKSLRKSIK